MNVAPSQVTIDGVVVQTSDGTLKENITQYTVLDKLDGYRTVEFDWKENGNHDIGIIAQELEQVFPELVVQIDGKSDGELVLAAQYNKLGALALQAVKEQQNQIDDYKLQLESQNNMINSLVDVICEEIPDREICH